MTKCNLKNLYLPPNNSHKGQNGKLLIIGGSHLFHSASLWALKVASRIVDLVHYSSVSENNMIVQKLKEEFRDGIIVPRSEVESYIAEDDCILIGPGMVRAEGAISNIPACAGRKYQISNIKEIEEIEHEGMQTYHLTKYLLNKYPNKKWVIDAGALQMMEPEWIPKNAILTPHKKEFGRLLEKIQNPLRPELRARAKSKIQNKYKNPTDKRPQEVKDFVRWFVKQYHCILLLKGEKDIVASKDKLEIIKGGNAGMTKGGTGDVLAGLVAALYCKNDAFLSACAASYINKKAGEDLYKKMGYWFNASDLADQIPITMRRLLLHQ